MNNYTLFIFLVFSGIFLVPFEFTATQSHYTHEWAVNIEGGEERAREIADEYGFVYVDKILTDYYLFRHNKVAKRSKFPSRFFHSNIAQDKRVLWLEQQVAKKRVKRHAEFTDPKWPKMWYLNRGNGLDMNVQKAWAMGYTGKGVAVTILDDGIEYKHPDLALNYDEKASYDVNSHDSDPTPRYEFTNENRHGTRCAGEVAAHANNSDCIVGVAYDAKIGGVRMLDGDVTDSVEAYSLGLNPQHIQIYSASWGPDDDGRTVDGPATLARKAFYDGIKRGRGGLGSIFVWASGNGGRDDDNCNCDGYTNSIYTLSISSVTESGKIPWYSEACSSTLATTYSSGSTTEAQIVTTDIRQSCTETHTGTSASAPLAAGLCALALQANPMLTWRDLQHIVVMTAKPHNLHDPTWTTNGVGRQVSHAFGYGLMDAAAMVELARNWSSVPQHQVCEVRSTDQHRLVPMNGKVSVPLYTDGCINTNNHVKYLEHVQARITLKASRRGEIRISLKSPMGTTSTLLEKRSQDNSRDGFNNWAFMTTHNWGELSAGQWILQIENGARSLETNQKKAVLEQWTLIISGTEAHPQARDITPPAEQPFTCSGQDSAGICIECQPGYYKLKDGCVKNCPKHYYGTMQVVNVRSTVNSSSTRTRVQRQGLCNPCNEACLTCKGPHVTDCFQCNDGYEKRDDVCQKKLLLNFLDPDMLGFFVWVIVLCIVAIVLFSVIFGLLQARDRRLLCWKGKRHLDKGKCEYNGITLTQEELENDLQNFDIIRNRNFRHGSLPESQDLMCRVHVNNFEMNHQPKPPFVKFDKQLNSNNSTTNKPMTKAKSFNTPPVSDSIPKPITKANSFNTTPVTSVQIQSNNINAVPGPFSDRKNRTSSEKSLGRKHTDSYVSFDINGTLTRTLGTDVYHPVGGIGGGPTSSSSSSISKSHRHPSYHSSRGSGSLRH